MTQQLATKTQIIFMKEAYALERIFRYIKVDKKMNIIPAIKKIIFGNSFLSFSLYITKRHFCKNFMNDDFSFFFFILISI